jgi:hypothetical protein
VDVEAAGGKTWGEELELGEEEESSISGDITSMPSFRIREDEDTTGERGTAAGAIGGAANAGSAPLARRIAAQDMQIALLCFLS